MLVLAGPNLPLKSAKYCLKKVKTFQKNYSNNTIPGTRIFSKLCAIALYHNNTELAPLKNFSKTEALLKEQNEAR